jgi:predicted nuclease of predicted toxin-antitoxin system
MRSEKSVVVDESVDFRFIEALQNHHILTHSILIESPGLSDDQVLHIANQSSSILLTEDKDFGELVIRLGKNHSGIVLASIDGRPNEHEIDRACKLNTEH